MTTDSSGSASSRCPWAITFGSLTTRCDKPADHTNRRHMDLQHEGAGLEEFPDQRVAWTAGDRREFTTSRADRYTWDVAS